MAMALVALKCPNCGGTVQFEEGMESGFCIHCGSKIVNMKSVSGSISIDRSSDIVNHLKFAKETLMMHEWESATKLIENIILMDADCLDAWYMKSLLHYGNKSEYEGILARIGNKNLESYGIFSKDDIRKCWGKYTLTFVRKQAPKSRTDSKTVITLNDKESGSTDKDNIVRFGVNPGKYKVSADIIVPYEDRWVKADDIFASSLTVVVDDKDLTFEVTHVSVGFWNTRNVMQITPI